MPDPTGGPLERYELTSLLGRGATTEVHRAHDRTLDRQVAVKVFAAHLDPAAEHRFDHEARALARLSHSGLVSIFDIGTVAARPYLVMQLVDGDSLAYRLIAGPMPVEDVVRMGAVLSDALAHAHARGVVHRDVKPSNILLDTDDQPYLTDFGIALLTGTSRLTSTNEILGTPAYLAPEQITGSDVGPLADIYSLGLVLLECATGEMEYAAGTRLEAALVRLHRQPHIPDTIPPDLAGLLREMTAKEPEGRPPAAECALRLAAMGEEPLTLVAAAPPGRRRRVLVAAGLTVASLGAGTVLALTALRSPSDQSPQRISELHPLAAQPAATSTTTHSTAPGAAGPSGGGTGSGHGTRADSPNPAGSVMVDDQAPTTIAGAPPTTNHTATTIPATTTAAATTTDTTGHGKGHGKGNGNGNGNGNGGGGNGNGNGNG